MTVQISPADSHASPNGTTRGTFLPLFALIAFSESKNISAVVVNGILIPLFLGYYLLRIGTDDSAKQAQILANALVLSISGPMTQVGYNWVRDVQSGQLALIRSVIPNITWYAYARVVAGAVSAAFIACLGCNAIAWIFDLPVNVVSVAVLVLEFAVTGVALCSFVSMIAAFVSHRETARSLIGIVALVMGILGPTFFERRSLPTILRWLAEISPYAPLTEATQAAFHGQSPTISEVAATLAVACLWSFVSLLIVAKHTK